MLVMTVVMLIKGHHAEVGVGVLPSERVEDVILDCDLDVVINDDGDVGRMMSFTDRFNRWS